MPATTITISAAASRLAMREQPVQAGHADVEDPLDPVARQLGGQGRLLGDRHVGGPRADHRDRAAAELGRRRRPTTTARGTGR